MYIIAENIHIISPKVKKALAERDAKFFQDLASGLDPLFWIFHMKFDLSCNNTLDVHKSYRLLDL